MKVQGPMIQGPPGPARAAMPPVSQPALDRMCVLHDRYLAGIDGGKRLNLALSEAIRLTFDGRNLADAELRGARLRESSLVGTKLVRANLFGADLRQYDMRHCDLSNADLRDAVLRGTHLESATLY